MQRKKMGTWLCLIVLTIIITITHAKEKDARDPKLISVFQVVKFKNGMCAGTSRNGTCYTQAECDNIGGTGSGTCADGFGVCCVVTMTTSGSSASVNNSYIVQTAFTAGANTYTICPCSDSICRIKFDFTTFTLAGPVTGFGALVGAGTAPLGVTDLTAGMTVGDCTTDTFQIQATSGRSSPLICGTNANQHMIIDVSGTDCSTVNMGIGASTTVTRSLDIQIIQYECGDDDVAGPPDCLQYFPGTAGKIRSFNFPDVGPGAVIPYNYVHLSNQHYRACVRRANASNYICYSPCTVTIGSTGAAGVAVINQSSFGLSGAGAIIVSASQVGSTCGTDYIWIPMGHVGAEMRLATPDYTLPPESITGRVNHFCGNAMNTAEDTAAVSVSICSYQTPFVVGVELDDDEICVISNANTQNCELTSTIAASYGSGILGFNLCYLQG